MAEPPMSEISYAKHVIRTHCAIEWPPGLRCNNCHARFPCQTPRVGMGSADGYGPLQGRDLATRHKDGAMVVTIEMNPARADEAAEARRVLAVHRPERDAGGLCVGCLEFACRLAWWPCPQARWAQSVLAAAEGGRS